MNKLDAIAAAHKLAQTSDDFGVLGYAYAIQCHDGQWIVGPNKPMMRNDRINSVIECRTDGKEYPG